MSKRVAIIGTRGYPSFYGGFETAVRRLAPYLADRGWDVTVYGRRGSIHADAPGRHPLVSSKITGGIESKSLSTLTYGLTSAVDAMVTGTDVALVMNVANGFWLPLLRAKGVPTVVNVDGIEWDRAKWGRFAKFVFHTGARMTARFGSRLVFDSTVIAKRWQTEFRRDGDFIPYGGDANDDFPIEEGLSHRGYALIVARFVPENTIDEFFDAVPLIAQNHDVVIVGSAGYGGELDVRARYLADSNDRVHWLGHISDDTRLHSLWQHAGAYFHGHSVGGTNPALVQAMACGAPIVARDTAYNREVLGDVGTFVQPTSTSIHEGIAEMLNSTERMNQASTNGKRRATEAYSWESVCAAYEQSLLLALKRQAS